MSSKDPKSNPAAEAMERLIAAQRVGQALFEREARRMATKHGLDDPRTQKMLRSAGGHATRSTRWRSRSSRARRRSPQPKARWSSPGVWRRTICAVSAGRPFRLRTPAAIP
ncbi:MAG: hypothetical protein HND48_21930 [Chloroflexi bacterium]|nr:hypothetical protein [Chloroflexota bacterium]